MTMRRTLWILLTAAACNAKPAAVPEAAVADSPDAGSKIDALKALAMSTPPAGTPVDKMLHQHQKHVEMLPKKADLWIELGRAWVRKARESADPGYYLNADAAADVVLMLEPDNWLAFNLKSLVLLNNHEFGAAKSMAERTLDKRPDDPMALGALSDALLELGDFEAAATAAQKMMDKKPDLPSYSRASYIRWLQGDRGQAKRLARLAFDSGRGQPDKEPATWQLVQAALLFWHEGDYEGADAGMKLALDYFPEFHGALVGKATTEMALGQYAQAIEHLEAAWRSAPEMKTAWMLGDAKTLAGDAAGAKEWYEKGIKVGRQTDKRTLSLYYSTKNESPELSLALAEAEKKTRGDIYTDDALAWALYRNGKIAEAKAAIEQATRLGTQDAQLLFHKGAILIAAGDAAAGKALIEKALQLNPKFDLSGAAEAKKLLGK